MDHPVALNTRLDEGPTTGNGPPACQAGKRNTASLDENVVFIIMEALRDSSSALKSCSLVCFDWFLLAHRWLFRVIRLRSVILPSGAHGRRRLADMNPDETLARYLDSLDSIAQKDTASCEPLPRVRFDFRPYVEEIHFSGAKEAYKLRTLDTHPPEKRNQVIIAFVRRIMGIISRLPNLRVVSLKCLFNFFRMTNDVGLIWSLFWTLAPRVEELRLRYVWRVNRECDPHPALEDLFGPTMPDVPCRIRSFSLHYVNRPDLSLFFDKIAGLDCRCIWPNLVSLRLPSYSSNRQGFESMFSQLGARLEHLRVDIRAYLPPLLTATQHHFLHMNLLYCTQLQSFELGCARLYREATSRLWDLLRNCVTQLPLSARRNVSVCPCSLPELYPDEGRYSYGVFGSHRCFDLRNAADVDSWWTAREDVNTLTVQITCSYEDGAEAVPHWFPKLRDSGKLRVVVQEDTSDY